MKLAFIGLGKMAEAIIQGILDSGRFEAGNIVGAELNEERLREMAEKLRISTVKGNLEAVKASDVVILAAKPQNFDEIMGEISGFCKGKLTQKLHARGPMSSCELTSTKFVVKGDYQVRK